MTTVTTYICDKQVPVTSVNYKRAQAFGNALEVVNNLVKVKIRNPECDPDSFRVKVATVVAPGGDIGDTFQSRLDCDFFEAMADRIGYGELSWAREIVCDDDGNFKYREKHITVRINHPSDPCHWKNTALRGVRKPNEIETYWSTVPIIVSDGLIPDNKSDMVAFDTKDIIENGQTQFVPGELLQVLWALKYKEEYFSKTVAGAWFATPAFTGGELLGTTGDSTDKLITVKVQGQSRICVPTDFAAYEDGDWVYVLKQGASEAIKTNRKQNYGDASAELTSESANNADYPSGLAGDILRAVNNERANAGLSPLKVSPLLAGVADAHTIDMAQYKYTEHPDFDGTTTAQRLNASGYLQLDDGNPDTLTGAGENVASGFRTAEAVVAAWMESPGHRANILHPDFVVVGTAVRYDDDGRAYATQDFGTLDETLLPDDNWEYRVAPVRFSNYGANGDFETIDYDLETPSGFEAGFEVSQHIGVISSVSSSSDVANVVIAGLGTFSGVEIFYHCPGSATVDGGRAAFSAGDEVIVLNEGGKPTPAASDLVIVGFKDQLKKCGLTVIVFRLITSTTTRKYKAVKIFSDGSVSEFDLLHPDGSGNLIDQPFVAVDGIFEEYSVESIFSFNEIPNEFDKQNAYDIQATIDSTNITEASDGTIDYSAIYNCNSCTDSLGNVRTSCDIVQPYTNTMILKKERTVSFSIGVGGPDITLEDEVWLYEDKLWEEYNASVDVHTTGQAGCVVYSPNWPDIDAMLDAAGVIPYLIDDDLYETRSYTLGAVTPPEENCEPYIGKDFGVTRYYTYNVGGGTPHDFKITVDFKYIDGVTDTVREIEFAAKNDYSDAGTIKYGTFWFSKNTGIVTECMAQAILKSSNSSYLYEERMNVYFKTNYPLMDGIPDEYKYDINDMEKIISYDNILNWFSITSEGIESIVNLLGTANVPLLFYGVRK